MTTKAAFLADYEQRTKAQAWAADQEKLDRFMGVVRDTVVGPRTPWAWNCPGAKATWKAIGCKGPMTLKALRGLP